ALASLEKSRVLQDQLARNNPTVGQYQFDLGQSLYRAGEVYRAKKQPTNALRAYREAQSILEDLVQKHPHNVDYSHILGRNLDSLGVTLKETGQLKEAAAILEEACTRQKAVFEKAPTIQLYRDALDTHLAHLADVHRVAGQAAAAVAV